MSSSKLKLYFNATKPEHHNNTPASSQAVSSWDLSAMLLKPFISQKKQEIIYSECRKPPEFDDPEDSTICSEQLSSLSECCKPSEFDSSNETTFYSEQLSSRSECCKPPELDGPEESDVSSYQLQAPTGDCSAGEAAIVSMFCSEDDDYLDSDDDENYCEANVRPFNQASVSNAIEARAAKSEAEMQVSTVDRLDPSCNTNILVNNIQIQRPRSRFLKKKNLARFFCCQAPHSTTFHRNEFTEELRNNLEIETMPSPVAPDEQPENCEQKSPGSVGTYSFKLVDDTTDISAAERRRRTSSSSLNNSAAGAKDLEHLHSLLPLEDSEIVKLLLGSGINVPIQLKEDECVDGDPQLVPSFLS